MPLPTYPPVDAEIAAPFWAGAAQGELRLPRCSVCGRFEWYPNDAGPRCPGSSYEWVAVKGAGVVFTHTRVERRFLPEGGDPPFAVGLVELDDAEGVRLVASLDESEGELAIGSRVRVRFDDAGGHARPVFVADKEDDR
jgi:uncharacterized OB-fold protein